MKKLKIILRSKWFYVGLLCLTLIYSLFYLSIPHSSKLDINDSTFSGIILEIKTSGDLLTLELKGKEKILGSYFFENETEKNKFLETYHLGDEVALTGTWTIPTNNTVPNLFNYKQYLNRKKIYYIMQIDTIEKILENRRWFYQVKNTILNHISHYKSKAYLSTFILGDTDFLTNDVIASYQNNGVSHLLAISGMHVSLLSGILLMFLKKLHFSDKKRYLFTMIFLLFYMVLSGSSPSISRAVVLFGFLSMNRIFHWQMKTFYLFILTFCILVVINPNVLFEVGFQYSFIISFFLILMQLKMEKASYWKGLFQVSMISFWVSLPISIYYFYQINFLSILLNLIFVPLVSFVVFPLSLLTILFPFLDTPFFLLTKIMENCSIFLDTIDIFNVILGKPHIWWLVLYYLCLIFVVCFRKKIGSLGIILLLGYQYFHLFLFPQSFFLMIDVGQGDSLLIHSRNHTMLIDTGGKISYEKEEWAIRETKTLTESTLLPLLKSLGIRKLDYLVLSHGDYDHLGEAINLIHNIKIENIVFNGGELNEKEQKIIEVATATRVSYVIDKQNNSYQIGDFQFISLNSLETEENDSSIVFFVKIGNYSFLLMGDSSVETEKKLLENYALPRIDFLKIGHHGSKTSTGLELLETIHPRFALISVGLNNRYNHPSSEVIERLETYNIPTFLTSIHGSICINFNKKVTFSINPP